MIGISPEGAPALLDPATLAAAPALPSVPALPPDVAPAAAESARGVASEAHAARARTTGNAASACERTVMGQTLSDDPERRKHNPLSLAWVASDYAAFATSAAAQLGRELDAVGGEPRELLVFLGAGRSG